MAKNQLNNAINKRLDKENWSSDKIEQIAFKENLNRSKKRMLLRCKRKLYENGVDFINSFPIHSCRPKDILDEYEKVFKIDPVIEYFNSLKERRDNIEFEINDSKTNNETYVYFIVSNQFNFCKIGFSANPTSRLKEIQTGCPFDLSIAGIIKGSKKREKEFHEMFKEYRTHGEWFKTNGKLGYFLADNFF